LFFWDFRDEGEMFRNTYQSGFLSILYSVGSKPLQIWDKKGVFFVVIDVFSFENKGEWWDLDVEGG
jgi:hypothetical protein